MNIRLLSTVGALLLLVGCGGGGSTGAGGASEIDTAYPFDIQKLTESTKQTYLDNINQARGEVHDCGHYRVDAEGNKVKDAEDQYIVDYTGDDMMPAVDSLEWNNALYAASAEHSADLAAWNHGVSDKNTAVSRVSHAGSGTTSDWTAQKHHLGRGSTIYERIANNAYVFDAGENIAVGTDWDEPQEAVDAWLRSPGHCKNLMYAGYKEVGMALVYDDGSFYKYYWTQNLGVGQ
jgi:uncharacterized protein YkwD